MRKIFLAILMVLVVMGNMTVSFAAAGYKDVNKRTIDSKSIKSIKTLKKAGAFKGVIKGKKFRPNSKMTRRQYLRMLKNLYPGRVTVTEADKKKAKKMVTEYYVTQKMVKVAESYGITITWDGSKKKLSRASVANYVVSFAEFDSAFAIN
ncbi:S-layer homology domain-containing protein [Candidatus Saccharibacteria bacterium]|nr:S-layer homology domain-containing protein [Candidatus Saccharibacteria bacterium]